MEKRRIDMRKILKRFLNLLSIILIVGGSIVTIDSFSHKGLAAILVLISALGVVIAINYVLFGEITLWHKIEN